MAKGQSSVGKRRRSRQSAKWRKYINKLTKNRELKTTEGCKHRTLEGRSRATMSFRRIARKILSVIAVINIFILVGCHGAKLQTNELKKQTKETNPFNFLRLFIMRLVYGIATMMGFEDGLANVANGAFVPPGVDDDDYGGLDGGFDGGLDLDSRNSYYIYEDPDDYY